MKKNIRLLSAFFLLLLGVNGCTTTHIFVVNEPVRAGSLESASADSFGGAVEKTAKFECPSNSVVELRVKRDFFNSLLGVITLGGYQKTDVEYYCGKNPDDDVPTLGGIVSRMENENSA